MKAKNQNNFPNRDSGYISSLKKINDPFYKKC